MQSTSHPNVFAGGDCVTMEDYVDKPYPTKAGVYAVRAGPIIAENVVHYIKHEPLKQYVPQKTFLALMMTGDGKAIGAKYGISFVGKWVWKLKDYIDSGFVKLFDPNYLFENYDRYGTVKPIQNNFLFEDERAEIEESIKHLRPKVAKMSAEEAALILGCDEDEEEFHERFMIMNRMHFEPKFCNEVVMHYNPPYYS